jgi:MFS family permease
VNAVDSAPGERPGPGGAAPGTGGFGAVLLPLLLVEMFSGVLQVYFGPLYPKLAERFHVDISTMSWSLTGWTLACVVLTPLLAKLGDVYGHRTVLRVDVALVALGSVLVAAAPDFQVLLVGRILEGALAAYLPLMFGLIRSGFDGRTTRRGIAYLSSVVLFGALVGSVAVGMITQYLHTSTWALWLPAVGTLIGFAALWLVPAGSFTRPSGMRIDWFGAATLAAGLASLLVGVSYGPKWGWSSSSVLGFLAAGLVVLAVWVTGALRTVQPLVDLRRLFRRTAAPIYLIGAAVYFGFLGGQVAISSHLGLPRTAAGLGLSPFGISMCMVPVFFLAFIAAASTARIGRRIGYLWTMVIGCGIVAAGFCGMALYHDSVGGFVALFSLAGLGNGLVEGSTRTLVVDTLRQEETSIGEGLYELVITTGAAVGSAVAGALLSSHVSAQGTPTEHGYVIVWCVTVLLCLLAAGAGAYFAFYLRRTKRPEPEGGLATLAGGAA